jgi:hypothetical protein
VRVRHRGQRVDALEASSVAEREHVAGFGDARGGQRSGDVCDADEARLEGQRLVRATLGRSARCLAQGACHAVELIGGAAEGRVAGLADFQQAAVADVAERLVELLQRALG